MWKPKDLIAEACARLPRNLTREEWKTYIGENEPYQVTCSNLPVFPVPTPTQPPSLMLEDAEGYDDNVHLNRSYTINNAWGANQADLMLASPPHVDEGTQSIAFHFDIRDSLPNNYCGFEQKPSPPQDWSGFSHLCLWVEHETVINDIAIQFGETEGEVWKYLSPLSSGAQELCLSLSESTFQLADWSPAQNGQMDLDAINYLGLYVSRTQVGSGVIYVDNIRLMNR